MENKIRFRDIEHIIREMLDMGKSFKISPNGISMLPLIREGRDSVYITKPTERLKKYDIAFFKRDNGDFVLHRVIKVTKKGYIFCGDNQYVAESGITDRHIIGIVSKIERNGNIFPVPDPEYIEYSKKVVEERLKKNFFKIAIHNCKVIGRKVLFMDR